MLFRMKLFAKVKAKYLDQLLSGEKNCEFRQFETLTLTDEGGRSRVFEVLSAYELNTKSSERVMDEHKDVPWIKGKNIVKLWLRTQKPNKS